LAIVEADLQPNYENITLYDTPRQESWAGVFVSKPYFKKVIASFGQMMKAVAYINGLLGLKFSSTTYNADKSELQDEAATLLGCLLHHDTITGASRSNIAEDTQAIALNFYNRVADDFRSLVSLYLDPSSVDLSSLVLAII